MGLRLVDHRELHDLAVDGHVGQEVSVDTSRHNLRMHACRDTLWGYEIRVWGAAMHNPILDTAEAAYACGRSERRIQQLVKGGLLENHGTPRRIRVRLSQVLAVAGDPLRLST